MSTTLADYLALLDGKVLLETEGNRTKMLEVSTAQRLYQRYSYQTPSVKLSC